MFSMELDAEVPQGTSLKQLRQDLERWAESENVDIELRVEH